MVYTTPDGISVLNLETHETKPVVHGRVRTIMAGRKSQNVYYIKDGVAYSTDVETGATREIAKLPPRGSVATVNADETLLAGTYIEGEGRDYGDNRRMAQGQQTHPLDQPLNKGQMMEERLAAHLPMAMFTVDIRTGAVKVILKSTDWLNHLLFSPTDPTSADVLSRRAVAQGGSHLDNPNGRQSQHADSQTDDGDGNRGSRVLGR